MSRWNGTLVFGLRDSCPCGSDSGQGPTVRHSVLLGCGVALGPLTGTTDLQCRTPTASMLRGKLCRGGRGQCRNPVYRVSK